MKIKGHDLIKQPDWSCLNCFGKGWFDFMGDKYKCKKMSKGEA